MCAISLVDEDRQWFKGTYGLTIRETPRHVSFCAYSILQTVPLVVPDTFLDLRFSRNPMVTGEPRIRFYAGFPLEIDGHAVGALCVFDVRPRYFFEDRDNKLARLTEFAAETSVWLASHKALAPQRPTRHRSQ